MISPTLFPSTKVNSIHLYSLTGSICTLDGVSEIDPEEQNDLACNVKFPVSMHLEERCVSTPVILNL